MPGFSFGFTDSNGVDLSSLGTTPLPNFDGGYPGVTGPTVPPVMVDGQPTGSSGGGGFSSVLNSLINAGAKIGTQLLQNENQAQAMKYLPLGGVGLQYDPRTASYQPSTAVLTSGTIVIIAIAAIVLLLYFKK